MDMDYTWEPDGSPNKKFIFSPCRKCIVLPSCKKACGKLKHIETIYHATWTKLGAILLFGLPICLMLLSFKY
jgi:hypothetical protein